MFSRYIAYLKNNPKKLWFKRKIFGWGWVPVRAEGMIVVLIYTISLFAIFLSVDRKSHSVSDTLYGIFLPFIAVTVLLILICFWKGERPHWQWGLADEHRPD